MSTKRLTAAAVTVVGWLALAPAASAVDLEPAAFFGTYKGTGVAQNRDSLYFGVTVRDLDVTIGPTGDGFNVSWTTVTRHSGDPDEPKIKRKSTSFDFVPSGPPSVYRAKTQHDPLSGNAYCWARIEGNTMTVYLLTIDAQGIYSMLSYARTLTGAGMDLEFTRIRDGEPVRTVSGKLAKHAE